jgi:hypothetical protein
MGFFGGSFGRGLVTGLAEGATRSIQTALDARNKEISSARQYLRTRRDQLADRAEKYDIRAKKAFDRLANETGSAARGLSLFQKLGDIDAVEQFIKDVDDTKRLQPGKPGEPAFNMSAALDWVEGNPMPDITREDALQAIRFEYKDPSVEFTDTSGLEKIGLGLSAERGQQLISGSIAAGQKVGFTRKPIEGLQNVTIDRSKLAPAINHAYEQSVRELNLRTKEKSLNEVTVSDYYSTQMAIANLDPTSENYEAEKKKLQGKANALLTSIKNVANAKDTSGQAGTVSAQNLLLRVLNANIEDGYVRDGINTAQGTFVKNGKTTFRSTDPKGYSAAVAASKKMSQRMFVENQRQADGSFNVDAANLINLTGLTQFMTSRTDDTSTDTLATETETKNVVQQPVQTQDVFDEKIRERLPEAQDYVNNVIITSPPLSEDTQDQLVKDTMRIYGVSLDVAIAALDKAFQAKAVREKQNPVAKPLSELQQEQVVKPPLYTPKKEREKQAEDLKKQQELISTFPDQSTITGGPAA